LGAVVKDQIVVGVSISRKPELTVDLFAKGFHDWELIDFSFGNSLPFRLHDLQIAIVNPDATDKESLLSFLRVRHDLGRYVKNVKVEFIDSLFADIFEIVLIQFCSL